MCSRGHGLLAIASLSLAALGLSAGCALERVSSGGAGDLDAAVETGDATPSIDAPAVPFDAACAMGPEEALVTFGAAELASGDAIRRDVEIDADRLVLAVQPYRYGALLVRGFASEIPIELDALAARPSECGEAFAHPDELDFGAGTPAMLSCGYDRHTVHASGEIRLEAGSHTMRAFFDDRGALRIALPSGPIELREDWPDTTERTFEVESDGWYPIEIAWSDVSGLSEIAISWRRPSAGTLEPIPPPRLRVARARATGREMMGWDDRNLRAIPDGARLDPDDTSVDWTREYPRDVGIGHENDFLLRWLARLRLGGDALRVAVASDDSHRVFVDGVFLGGDYATSPRSGTYATALPDGTYDLVLELLEASGDAFVRFGRDVDTAPWPAASLRPATRFGGRAHAIASDEDQSVGPENEQELTLTLAAPDGDAVAVEVSAIVRAVDPSQVDVRIELGASTWEEPLAASSRPGESDGTWIYRRVLRASDGLVGSAGDWRVAIVNRDPDEEAQRDAVAVLAHHGGVSDPYPASGEWESAAVDLGAPAEITGATADAFAYFGTSIDLDVRAAADAGSLGTAGWIAVDPASGAAVSPLAGRYAQVRATLRGPTHDTPRARAITLRGRRCAGP